MKTVIFNDKENSDRSLNRLNKKRNGASQRFWKIDLVHRFIFEKVKSIIESQCHCLELGKTLIYTGEYNPRAINNVKKVCGNKIKRLNELIKKEELLLSKINLTKEEGLKEDVIKHVTVIKEVFEEEKRSYIKAIEQQNKKAEGQKKFFNFIKEKIKFVEIRTTPLVTRDGRIQQKGVDAKFATDLILLAQANAFDVAILLTGDADLKESIHLIRERYGKIVVLVAYYSKELKNDKLNTISEDLLNECDYFINLYDLTEEEINTISSKKREKIALNN